MEMPEMTPDSKVCYTCLRNADCLVDLQEVDGDKTTYMNKLSKIVTLQLVPREVMALCTTCVGDLKTSYRFIEMVSKSQNSWKKQGVNIKEEVSANNNDVEVCDYEDSQDYKISLAQLKEILEKETTVVYTKTPSPQKRTIIETTQDSSSDEDGYDNDNGPLSPVNVKYEATDSDDDFLCNKIAKDFGEPKDDASGKEQKDGQASSGDEEADKPEVKPKKRERKAAELPHKCNLCEAAFNKKWRLHKHLARIHEQEKKFVCNFCDKAFKQSYHLKEHLTSHTGEKNFTCELCDKKFQRASSVKRHMKSHEAPPGQKTKRTPFLCNICGKNFPFSNGVQRHMRVHLGIKRHECNICHRKFTQSTHLHVHMRTHTGEKPYICDTCGEAFSLKARLQKHMSTLHETETLVFICNFCGVSFRDKLQLATHTNNVHTQIIPDGIPDIKLFY